MAWYGRCWKELAFDVGEESGETEKVNGVWSWVNFVSGLNVRWRGNGLGR